MLRSGEFGSTVHDRVIREGVEPIIRSLGVVKKDPAISMLQDRLEPLLGGFLLDMFEGRIRFGWAKGPLILMDSADLAVLAPTPAPTFLPVRMSSDGPVPPSAPASTLGPAADFAALHAIEAMEPIHILWWKSTLKEVVEPVGRWLMMVQTGGVDHSGSLQFCRKLPRFGDMRVMVGW